MPLHPSSEIDEAHEFKNLQTDANIRDAAITGSKRASDLHMKLEYLRSRHGARIATLATATPIANSITEAHVMSRYLRPDLLARAGVEDFDSWAATFGQTVTEIEIAPTGGGDYRLHTRFARFQNVPEMLRLWHVFADVKTAEDLGLPVPELAQRPDGQRAPIAQLIAASPELTGYVQQLSERAEKVRGRTVDPSEDNMLKITGDGRKAALDMQLVTGQPASAPGKLQAAAANIARLYHATRAREYLDPVTGQAVTDARRVADRVLRPLHTGRRGLERLRPAPRRARRPRRPRRAGSATSTRPATMSRRPACSRLAAPGR